MRGLAREGVDFVLIREKQLGAGELAVVAWMVLGAVRAFWREDEGAGGAEA